MCIRDSPKPHPPFSKDFHPYRIPSASLARGRQPKTLSFFLDCVMEIFVFAMKDVFQLYEIQNEFFENHRKGEWLVL